MKTIELTQGKVAIVDDADYAELNRYSWRAHRVRDLWYARRPGKSPSYMHAIINGTPRGMRTDHVNGDGLDNRRRNLRSVSDRRNQYNRTRKAADCTSQYRGVSWSPRGGGMWLAQISIGGVKKPLGLRHSEHDAAGLYDAAGIERDPDHFTPNFSASWLAPP